jgi:purine-binding chemotaxis protein CheW
VNNPDELLAFALDGQRYALPLSSVEKVVRSVEITPLPKAPDIVLGVINVQGRVIPVFNVRRRFRLPEREISLEDRMIIAHTARRAVSLAVEQVEGVMERPSREPAPSGEILPAMEYVEGVVTLADGMVFIHNLDTFLSLDEERALDSALEKRNAED